MQKQAKVETGIVRAGEQRNELARVNTANPIGAMINALLGRAETPEMLTAATATVKELIAAYNTQEDRQAARDFAADFSELQAAIPTLIAQHEVKNRDGSLRYKCKPLAEILDEIKPILCRFAFSVHTDFRWDGDRAVAVVEIIHRSGHSRKSEFAVIKSPPPPGGTASEADEGTMTRAMRRGLCAALNIAVSPEDDRDARAEGSLITPQQVEKLRRLVADTRSNEARFLGFAGSDTYEGIRAEKFPVVLDMLNKKMAKAAPQSGIRDAADIFEDQAPPEREPGQEG